MKQYFPNIAPVPDDPDLAVAALFTATRNYKSELISAQYRKTDIGRGHHVERSHIDQWSAPWFVRTKGAEPHTDLSDHIGNFAERLKAVALQDPELKIPFGSDAFTGIGPADADRLMILAASALARVSLGYHVGSRSRGEAITPDTVLQEVRKWLYFVSQDFTVGNTKRPIVVPTPFLPLWKNMQVGTYPQHQMPFPITALEGKKNEQAIARHLIGPNLNQQVSDASETRIGAMIQKALPHLLDTRRTFHLIFLHDRERKQLNALLKDEKVFTPELREKTIAILEAMLINHHEFSADQIDGIRKAVATGLAGSSDPASVDTAYAALPNPIDDDATPIINAYVTPVLPAEGQIATPEQAAVLRKRMPILAGKIAMLIDELHATKDAEIRTSKEGQLTLCVESMSRMCQQIGSDAGPFQTIARMLTLAYCDKDPVQIRTYI